MARIDLNEPYQNYLESLVDAGLFRSVTAAAESAIHQQMLIDEERRLSSIAATIAKGEDDIKAGRTIPYSPGLMDKISRQGQQDALDGKPVKHDIKP